MWEREIHVFSFWKAVQHSRSKRYVAQPQRLGAVQSKEELWPSLIQLSLHDRKLLGQIVKLTVCDDAQLLNHWVLVEQNVRPGFALDREICRFMLRPNVRIRTWCN